MPVIPKDNWKLLSPILICRLVNVEPAFGEEEPHIVQGIVPSDLQGRWLVLGSGNGLRIKVEARSVNGKAAPVIRVDLSHEPVRYDEWNFSF
jgi:hypothetical protein